jgi:hypothetical protein
MSKINFIIWRYLERPIRVEETNTLSKTYTHRCEPDRFSGQAWQSRFSQLKRGRKRYFQGFLLYEIATGSLTESPRIDKESLS